jgi:hypothetical protein
MDATTITEVPLEHLEASICQGAANLTAAEHTWLLQVAEFDRRRGWEVWGCHSCAFWLCWQVGLDNRTANEKVRVANALVRFPLICEAMRTGQLSYSKVRAITRIAKPETELGLVQMATAGTTNHVERIVSAYRRAEPVEAMRENRQFEGRALHDRVDDDGSVVITMRLPAEAGRAFLAAVAHFIVPAGIEADGSRVPLPARRADAAVDMAEAAVAGGEATVAAAGPRYLVTLHASTDGMREIEGAGDLSDHPAGVCDATAERMCCDADVETVTTDAAGNLLHMSDRSSVVKGRLRRAVVARDRCCTVPGCSRKGRYEIHHLLERGLGGCNDPANLTLVCRFHHHRLHEGEWCALRTPQGVEFLLPGGRVVRNWVETPVGAADAVAAMGRSAADGRCQWIGDRLDLDMALTSLFSMTDSLGSRRAG